MYLNTDFDALLPALGDEQPCGPNLEYAPDFLQLEEAARERGGDEFAGDSGNRITSEGKGPNWLEVRQLAENLLKQTRDIRIAVYYTRALLRTEGFGGIQTGLHLILSLLKAHWAHVHPELDADDGNDPTMRLNALAPLVANDAVIGDLRNSYLFRSRQSGELRVRDIEIVQGKLSAREGEPVLPESQVSSMLAEALDANPQLADAITGSLTLAGELGNLLQAQLGDNASIDLTPLHSILSTVQQCLLRIVPSSQPGATESAASAENIPVGASTAVATYPVAGEIRSRADVMATIDRLVTYLEKAEPTNPAQWLLRRAQRVMTMNFLEAIVELAPDALEQTERMVGSRLHPE